MSSQQEQSYYDVLAVTRTASQGDIKRAFRKLAKRYHPDTNPRDDRRAAKKLKEIIKAYKVLSNERERARYDVMMRTSFGRPAGLMEQSAPSLATRAERILHDLLKGCGQRALETYDEFSRREKAGLSRHMEVRDYLDCTFLLAEQCERVGRYEEAADLYEELYRREKDPPRHRYFFEEVKARIKTLYSRKLPREARSAEEEVACYERILEFDVDKSERAFILKKIAEVHCRLGNIDKAREIFGEALHLKPGLKGTATIRERLGMQGMPVD